MPAGLKPKGRRKPQRTCRCLGYWFPHRHTSKYCEDYQGVKDEDYWRDHPANQRRGAHCA